mmetsp:Transcript_30812/g.77331  ORF Transcript_30812/g.77331 Transcript_30812/m.77331 type:complete len:227 (-) Transcript_30812:623-1303(-)
MNFVVLRFCGRAACGGSVRLPQCDQGRETRGLLPRVGNGRPPEVVHLPRRWLTVLMRAGRVRQFVCLEQCPARAARDTLARALRTGVIRRAPRRHPQQGMGTHTEDRTRGSHRSWQFRRPCIGGGAAARSTGGTTPPPTRHVASTSAGLISSRGYARPHAGVRGHTSAEGTVPAHTQACGGVGPTGVGMAPSRRPCRPAATRPSWTTQTVFQAQLRPRAGQCAATT